MHLLGETLRLIAGLIGVLLLIGLAMSFFGFWPVIVFMAASALITTATGYRWRR